MKVAEWNWQGAADMEADAEISGAAFLRFKLYLHEHNPYGCFESSSSLVQA